MASKSDYRTCMADGMRGKKLSKEERQREFCLTAKICSKSVSREEAQRLCALPKAPKAPKVSASIQRTPEPAQLRQAPSTAARPVATDPNDCNREIFMEAASQYTNLYAILYPEQSHCSHCETLRAQILAADIKHPIVDVPGDVCTELADSFGIDRYPSVVHLKRGKVKAVHTGNPDTIIRKMMEGK